MNTFQLTYKPYGNSAILVEWPQKISKEILNDIRLFTTKLENSKIEDVLEFNFVYSSLLVTYKSNGCTFNSIKIKLQLIYNSEQFVPSNFKKTIWKIPVCYDVEFGIDLMYLSIKKNMSIEEIISRHCSVNYTVFGIGFLPGFLYLGGLLEKLHFPRRDKPRLNVLKGSVAIGENQTGIYPQTSPGGWNIIGKTPVSLFTIKSETPCVIKPGDEIQFVPISKENFKKIEFDNNELKKVLT